MNIMDKNNKHLYEKMESVLYYDQSTLRLALLYMFVTKCIYYIALEIFSEALVSNKKHAKRFS